MPGFYELLPFLPSIEVLLSPYLSFILLYKDSVLRRGTSMFIEDIDTLIERQPTSNISYKIQFDGDTYTRNPNQQFRSASTIKVPISVVNLQHHIDDYKDIKLKVGKNVGGSGVLHTLRDIEALSLWDTIVLSIIVSDNTASNMLMNHIGFEALSTGFSDLGLKNSVAGLNYYDFEAAAEGKKNLSTSGDMFKSIQSLDINSNVLPDNIRKDLFDVLKSQQFNDRVGGYIEIDEEKGEFIASKTGSVDGLEHEFGIIYKNGKKLTFSKIGRAHV